MLKSKIILITFLVFIFSPLSHTLELPHSDSKPIAVVIERDQWQACTETPTMALYEDGTFIFSDMSLYERCKYKYKQKKLSDNEINQLKKSLVQQKNLYRLTMIICLLLFLISQA